MSDSQNHGVAKRLLGLFAHPDDEVFCIGGTFALASSAGAETKVVSFTQGEAGAIRRADIATRSTLGRVRAGELTRACLALNVSGSECLSFRDGHLTTTDRDELVEAAVKLIRSFRPDQVFSFDQTGAYGHPDHIVMSEVARAACERAGDASAFPEAGEPFTPTELLQARFPQNDRLLLRVLVDWLTAQNDRFRGSDEFMNALLMFADGTSMLGYASDHLHVEWFPKGAFIIEQGEPAVSLHLVLSGAVDVITEDTAGVQTRIGSARPGEFLGETGIAHNQVRNAHCVAAENTACFVLSPAEPSPHAGRGAATDPASPLPADALDESAPQIDLQVNVSEAMDQKVCALAAHRSQYAISPGLFPDAMLHELLGSEYFFRAWTAHPAE